MLEILVTIMLVYFGCEWYAHREDEKNAEREANKWRL